MRRVLQCVAACLLLVAGAARAEGIVESLVLRFAESDFEFLRGQSNAPFLPIAWVNASRYQEVAFTQRDGTVTEATFQQSALSQGAFLPLPAGERDAFVVGEWLSATHFDETNGTRNDFDVYSVAIPLGWIQQRSRELQLAAFLSPLGSTTADNNWYWETLGGVFGRYLASDRTAWIFGLYFDIGALDDFYTPYVGATFIVNERWTINAVMPWPSVSYAPTPNTFFSLGVTPSGASWSVEDDVERPRVSLSSWNFGLAVQHRVYKNLWAGVEVGVAGIRGLTILGGDWQSPQTRLDNTGFALLTMTFRPAAATAKK